MTKKLIQQLLFQSNSRKKFYPHTMEADCYLPLERHKVVDLSIFNSYEEVYHQLNIDLVVLQAMAIEAAMGSTPIKKMYISGDFCDDFLPKSGQG